MPDIAITCTDCGRVFAFTEGEQKYFKDMAARLWNNEYTPPKRCKPCRLARKAEKAASAAQADPPPVEWGGGGSETADYDSTWRKRGG